ncbi:MAG: AhpC/TSA family protein [Muribaculaceae bacterium]|nr:AhpC/TSA family protein [Muribaculaceae bacterium]
MKLLHVLAGSMLVLSACTPAVKNSYTIKGSLAGIPDSTVLVLTEITDRTGTNPLAEAIAVDGKFKIEGVAPEPRLVLLLVKDNHGFKKFMLENNDIVIEGNVTSSEAGDGKTSYDFDKVTVSGSQSHQEYLDKTLGRRQIDSAMISLHKENQDIYDLLYSLPRGERLDSLRQTERFKKLGEAENAIFAALDSNYRATVEANKETFWGPLLMYAMVNYMSPNARDMYEQLGDSAKESFYGQFVYGQLYPVGRPGDKMPEFKAKDINGNEVDIVEFCKGKKAVLLDFWASWCGPCRREIPNLKEIYKNNADKGFDILSISIDAEEEPWLKAVKDEDLKWTNVRDTDHSIADLYKVSAVPTMYVVDGNACLVAENLRGQELADKIAELVD